jgi:hypothetical protein
MNAKRGITKIAISTKMPGIEGVKEHRPGIKCLYERHATQPGQYIIWIGKRYAVVEAIRLHDTIAAP